MATKKELLDNELMKEIISIRTEALWKMIYLKEKGMMPGIYEEGATSEHDNKGAMFIPGGYVLKDSDECEPSIEEYISKRPKDFRKYVRAAMQLDNAVLMYNEGMAIAVNLDNGFFSKVARSILDNKNNALKRSRFLKEQPPKRVTSEEIVKSHCPSYVPPPYGSRTKLSSCVSVCISEPRMYFQQLREEFQPTTEQEEKMWNSIKESRKPIVNPDGIKLAPPYLIICHSTRYKKEIMTGITRILGIGKFGEFSTFTLEEATNSLMSEMENRRKPHKDEVFAKVNGSTYVGVLRTYPGTNYGRRLQTKTSVSTMLISPKKEVGLDLEEITERNLEKYELNK